MKFLKNSPLFVLLIFTLSVSASGVKKKKIPVVQKFDYAGEFRKVDSLMGQVDQPQAALKLLAGIQDKAASEGHTGYYVKCIQYRVSMLKSETEEDDTSAPAWNLLSSEISKGRNDIKVFLLMDAASYLRNIFDNNRWQTDRIAADHSKDPKQWGTEKLNHEILKYIDQALKLSGSIAGNPVYEPLIDHYQAYDFRLGIEQVMIRSAIQTLDGLETTAEATYRQPLPETALSTLSAFLSADFNSSDDPKNEYRILQLYQLFLNSVKNDPQAGNNAFIYFELERLAKMKEHYNADLLYLKTLEQLYSEFSGLSYSNLIAEKMAEYHLIERPFRSMEIVKEALAKYPGFLNEKNLINLKRRIEAPELQILTEALTQPGKKILARVNYKNLSRVYIAPYHVNLIDFMNARRDGYGYHDERIKTYLDSLKPFTTPYTIDLPIYNDYLTHSSEIALDGLPEGYYVMVLGNAPGMKDSGTVKVYGNIAVAPYTIITTGDEMYLKNATNGTAAVNEVFRVYSGSYGGYYDYQFKKIYEGRTNAEGYIDLNSVDNAYKPASFIVEIGNHLLYENTYLTDNNRNPYYPNSDNPGYKVITDRSIYRPGQKVYFKCIVYDQQLKKTVAGKQLELVLKNNNGEEKGKISLTSNAYGSASGEFNLPSGGFNTGNFSILVNQQYGLDFRVEEYKRPKYQAAILPPAKAYKLNDEVTVTGEAKAFAGYAVQDAKVTYTVIRRLKPAYFPWAYFKSVFSRGEGITLLTGNTVTDAEGKFSMKFKAEPDLNVDFKSNPYFIFAISAVVTDQNGEVKTCNYDLTIAYTDLQLKILAKEENTLGKPVELTFSSTNLQDRPLPFSGTILIEKQKDEGQIMRRRFWNVTDTTAISEKDFAAWFPNYTYSSKAPVYTAVLTRNFNNDNKGTCLLQASEIKEAGTYRATMQGPDSRGEIVTAACEFKVIPGTAGPYLMADPLRIQLLNGNSFEPGRKAKFLVSSGLPGANVIVEISSKRGLIMKQEVVLDRSSKILTVPVTTADRGNMVVTSYTVNDYRHYQLSREINVPYSNKELSISLQSFRDDMEPGSKEKWIVKLKGPASEKAAMESVAVMYDQSLDAIYENANWHLNIFDNYYRYDNFSSSFEMIYFDDLANVYGWADDFNAVYQFRIPTYRTYMLLNAQEVYYSNSFDSDDVNRGNGVKNGVKGGTFKQTWTSIQDKKGEDEPVNRNEIAAVIRKNFDETAFFYPHLLAGKKGEILLEFTMPEALTQWKMRMLSHSTTMQSGYFEKRVTTSRKLMVQPNIPRFLRQGDVITLVTKVVNTTNAPLVAQVGMTLTDETSGLPLIWTGEKGSKSIQVPANSSVPFSYTLTVPDYTGVITITCSATAGSFSDGEQHTLPVLSKRTLITESLPLTIRNKGTQNIAFNHLKNNSSGTLEQEKLSVEMSTNPAWYAIQALPYLMEFPHECAEQTFTRLYANSIATYLANSDPAIRKTYNEWVLKAAEGKGLQSRLMLNQDLKNVLIEETPWLNDGKNEAARMQRLGLLFNEEKIKEEQQSAFEKLKQMQLDNGGFGWFKGMQPNAWITQTIVVGFGKMQRMGVDISPYRDMITRSMNYLDAEARRDYLYFRSLKVKADFYPSNLQYLYCKSYFPEIGLGINDSIVKYFTENSEKYWAGNNLMNRAQLSTALRVLKPGSEVPGLILRSFSENAKNSTEMGMYWPAAKNSCYWYDAPIETHVAIIEAFALDPKLAETLKEQQIWLLRQKQTGDWGSTRSTADACYALLMHGNSLNTKQQVIVKIGNRTIQPQTTEAGTGYFREDIPKEQISAGSGDVQITAATDDFAYGAVYWQYFEDMDKVQKSGSGLSINKKIFRVENTAKGRLRTEITASEITVGDMIEVSLNIICDRDLEFVHIKDLRGAGTEPVDALSEYRWQNGLGYYQSTRDAATHFFIDRIARGNYQINYSLKVEQAGNYGSGTATIQCMYAPEFTATSTGMLLKVK